MSLQVAYLLVFWFGQEWMNEDRPPEARLARLWCRKMCGDGVTIWVCRNCPFPCGEGVCGERLIWMAVEAKTGHLKRVEGSSGGLSLMDATLWGLA